MIVSWDWLREYVQLPGTADEFGKRVMMAGLNLESVQTVGADTAIDLEVTSNRVDCLGTLGVAREAAVCFGVPLSIPAAQPQTGTVATSSVTRVDIEALDLCPRYIARVIRGAKVGPSPAWLRNRLETLGIASINNVVDVTNYVLMECGQPLHAFDADKLAEGRIVVRRARAGESIQAIDHKEYKLTSDMCVIADAQQPVAIAGVMGGAATEIGTSTTNILIEVADFASMSIRATARALKLHSDSSYRFERGVDPAQMEWASRRCCELILQVAGGELLAGSVDVGPGKDIRREPVTLRFGQLRRILGIDVPVSEVTRILTALGLKTVSAPTADAATFEIPTWRARDLTREIDLIEEVARIYGYDKIPEDAVVPLTVSQKTLRDRVIERAAEVLTSAGFFEAITLSLVDDKLATLFSPRESGLALRVDHDKFTQLSVLRSSLIPSLLQSRRNNERQGIFNAQLFEIAAIFLKADPGNPAAEPKTIGLVTGKSFADVKGLLAAIAQRVNPASTITTVPREVAGAVDGRSADVLLNGVAWGWLGELDRSVTDQLDLRDAVVAAEVSLTVLEATADLRPRFAELPVFPTISRDLNFVLNDEVTWSQIETIVSSAAGPHLESLTFSGQYRGPQLPADKKSYLLTLHYRAADRTLTNDEVEAAQQAVIRACEEQVGAKLR